MIKKEYCYIIFGKNEQKMALYRLFVRNTIMKIKLSYVIIVTKIVHLISENILQTNKRDINFFVKIVNNNSNLLK